MKRFISICLFAVYLLSATEVHQLFKLPVMIKHFVSHKKGDDKISFVKFLRLHYSNSEPHDADDMKLPFKSADDCCLNITPVTCPTITASITPPVSFDLPTEQTPLFNSLNPSLFIKAIFQPPKFC